MSTKSAYRDLCAVEPTIPLFSQAWWLDAVCGDDWDVCVVEKGGRVVATMPYHYRYNVFGMRVICQPPETQTLGPWLRSSNSKLVKRLAEEKDLLGQLAEQLPDFSHFQQNWHHNNTNWLPFFWRGFSQTTRYTYRLPDLSNIDSIWRGLKESIRGDIRKAENRYGLSIETNASLDAFMALNVKTFQRQGLKLPYTRNFITKLDSACKQRSSRAIFIATDSSGRHHAGVYTVWNKSSAYYLMGGADPELRSSGATALCLWSAIKHASTVAESFDFEGSMMEPVERFVRAFGASQTPYFVISKTPSRLLRAGKCFHSLVKQ